MFDYKFLKIVVNYYNIFKSNKSNNIRERLVKDLLNKYKVNDDNNLLNSIMIYMYSHLMYFSIV
jgi:uncharacterized phage-associated protein